MQSRLAPALGRRCGDKLDAMQPRHAFVTGGTGFLGRRLVATLRQRGWRVTMLARAELAQTDVVRADLRDARGLLEVLPEQVDVVFHVAANVDFNASRAQVWADNVEGTDNLLEAALARRARRFVFTSTAGIWGLDQARFDEESPRHGQRAGIAYLDSKLAAEASVQRARQRGLQAVILNPGHIVGPASAWDSLFAELRAGGLSAVPPGAASWCEVEAVVEAHVAAAERGRDGMNYLLGGCDASYAAFCAAAARRLGVRPPRTAPAVLVRTSARLAALQARWSGSTPRLAPDLAKILCSRMLFSSARASQELDYRALPLDALLERALPTAQESLMSARASERRDRAER
jgi:dihydroflavonol-4-reductase